MQAKSILPLPCDSDEGLLVVAIDSSWIGARWALYQIWEGQKCIALYGSCTFNKTQQNYRQLKTKVFETFMGLKDLCHQVWGVHFCLEHDAISLAWLFNFKTKHIKAESFKTEDALSRCPPFKKDEIYNNIDTEEFLDAYNLTYGSLNRLLKDVTPLGQWWRGSEYCVV